jgi:hypothetical protein
VATNLNREDHWLTVISSTATISIVKILNLKDLMSFDPTFDGVDLSRWSIIELVSSLRFTAHLTNCLRMWESLQSVFLPYGLSLNASTKPQETSTPAVETDEDTTPRAK